MSLYKPSGWYLQRIICFQQSFGSLFFWEISPKKTACLLNIPSGRYAWKNARSIEGQISPPYPWTMRNILGNISHKWSSNNSQQIPEVILFRKYLPKPFSKTVQHLLKVFFHSLGGYFPQKTSGICWGVVCWPFLCLLKMFSGMPPRRYFQNDCVVLADISQNMCLPLGETSSQRLLETNSSWKKSPRGFSTTDLPNRFPLRNGLMPYYPIVF